MKTIIHDLPPVAVYLFVALPSEAKPVISWLGLKKIAGINAFSIFRSKQYCLTVTGLGKTAMAAGVAFTIAKMAPADNPVMLNLGIAGHKTLPVGSTVCAEKIQDADNGKNCYPQLVIDLPCQTGQIFSVSRVSEGYQPDRVYDMEASAFFEIAAKFTSLELIQCMKVISDNSQSPSHMVNPKQAQALIQDNITPLQCVLNELQKLRLHLDDPVHPDYTRCIQHIHFSVTEKERLKKLLNQWDVLTDNQPLNLHIPDFDSGKAVLEHIQNRIDGCKYKL